MAKADGKRIEALAREAIAHRDLCVLLPISETVDLREVYAVCAEEWCCLESDVPAIIEKARKLLPKAG